LKIGLTHLGGNRWCNHHRCEAPVVEMPMQSKHICQCINAHCRAVKEIAHYTLQAILSNTVTSTVR